MRHGVDHYSTVCASLFALAVSGYFETLPRVRRDFVRFVFVQLAVAGAMLLPWTIRNSYALGAPVWGRSNFGLELHVSNNGLATATWDGNKERGVFLAMQPTANDAERMRVRESGEVVYNCEKFRQADTWIATHPQRFSTITVERAFLFWFPSLLRPVQTVALAAVTLAGMSGFVLFWRCAFTAAPLCIFQASGRLRYPIEWMFYLFTAYAIYRWSSRTRRARQRVIGIEDAMLNERALETAS